MERLTVPQGEFQLARFPPRRKELLRAWDAADEYLLHQVADEGLCGPDSSLLIANDSFGALSVALAKQHPVMWSDSWLARQGTLANLQANGLSTQPIELLDSLQVPSGRLDLVLIKVPKSLAMLEDQLYRLRPHLHAGSRVIAAGMVKQIHTSTLKLFERIVGPTHTSLARKKARLIFCQYDPVLEPGNNPYPSHYILEGTDYRITNHAAVFSRQSLDIGTRFFLEHIPRSDESLHIIDLGCGNGLVGLTAAERNPQARLTFVDESMMAVASAEANFKAAFGDSRHADFQVTDCLSGIAPDSADLILNNPPFHQQQTVGDAIAWQMFSESRTVLRPRGQLWVIGNRHLAYHAKLKRLFGNCRTIASNRKFVILQAIKR